MIKNLKNARSNKNCPYCKTDICIRHMKFEKPKKEKIRPLIWVQDDSEMITRLALKVDEIVDYINYSDCKYCKEKITF